MSRDAKEKWTLAELAEETGLSPRTIRYYISRGLLAGPEVAGRSASYGAGHLARLRAIQELQAGGAMLAEIGRMLSGERLQPDLPPQAAWHQYALADDLMVWVRADAAPWRSNQIRKALAAFASRTKREGNHGNDDGRS